MKIYVASAFGNQVAVREAQARLRDRGATITHDWTREDASEATGAVQDYLTECADNDFRGIEECDVLILLDHPDCRSAYCEVGIALGLGKHVIVVSPVESMAGGIPHPQNLFHLLVTCVDTLGGALVALAAFAEGA